MSLRDRMRTAWSGEKTLLRMLNRKGNPTARNLGLIVKSIAKTVGIKPRVELGVH